MQGLRRQIVGLSKGIWTSSPKRQSLSCVDNSMLPWHGALKMYQPDNGRSLHYFRSYHAFGSNGVRSLNPTRIGQQQIRGIRVKVRNGNVEEALRMMQRKIISSGMERLIKNAPRWHVKDSEKRILAEKRRHKKERSLELAKKLKSILIQKVRGL